MPNLIGFTVSQASGLLSGDNVTLNSPSRAWSTQPANTIMDQSPAPYSSLAGVAAVSVTVSNGPSPLSASLPANKSVVQITIPSSAAAKSLLKVVVTDQADNQEVYYQQVNPGQVVSYPVDWYGNNGQMMVYINGQAEPAKALTTNPSSSPSGTSPSTAPSSPASGG